MEDYDVRVVISDELVKYGLIAKESVVLPKQVPPSVINQLSDYTPKEG